MENSAIKEVKSTELLCHEFNQWYCCCLTVFTHIYLFCINSVFLFFFPIYPNFTKLFSYRKCKLRECFLIFLFLFCLFFFFTV